tara:strand:+ start:1513 stop:1953 length:441 start_codon:yes stop_codon:yes gene_type:complete
MYERLIRRDDLTELQEALLLFVHIKKKKIQLRTVEIIAITGIVKENHKQMMTALENFQDLLFPGQEKKASFEDNARDILAEETRKIFEVPRSATNPVEAAKDGIRRRGYATTLDRHYIDNRKKYGHKETIRRAMERSNARRGKKSK